MIITALSLALASVAATQPSIESETGNVLFTGLTLPHAASPAPSSIQAAGPSLSYSYLYITKGWGSYDGIDEDSDILEFGVSFELGDALFATISLGNEELKTDLLGFDVTLDSDVLALGLGAHTPLSDSVDLVGGFSLIQVDQELSDGVTTLGADGDGFRLGVGIRAMVSAQLELNAALLYIDIEDEDDTAISLGGAFGFTENLAATGSYSTADDVDVLGLGLRFYF